MKKLVLALSVLLIAGFSTVSAKIPAGVSDKVKSAFNSEFNRAKNVRWSENSLFVVAQFDLDNKVLFAYYKPDGSFIGIIHHLLTTDLSDGLRKALKKRYGNYWVTDLFKMDNEQGTSYYVKLENESESVILNSDDYDGWNNYKIISKSEKNSATL